MKSKVAPKNYAPEIKALSSLFDAFEEMIKAVKLQAEMTKLIVEHLDKQDVLLNDIYSYIDDIKNATERLESKP